MYEHVHLILVLQALLVQFIVLARSTIAIYCIAKSKQQYNNNTVVRIIGPYTKETLERHILVPRF